MRQIQPKFKNRKRRKIDKYNMKSEKKKVSNFVVCLKKLQQSNDITKLEVSGISVREEIDKARVSNLQDYIIFLK